MKILALTKYGPLAASTRQRFLQYRPALAIAGMELAVSPLLGDAHVRRLVSGKSASPAAVAGYYLDRLRSLMGASEFDLIWLHCEAFPFLPPVFERLVFAVGKPVVFDYDDAIFHSYDASANPLVRALLGKRLHPVIRGAAACICGNAYLRDYAARLNPNCFVVPTVVDTETYVPAPKPVGDRLTIGWIGSPTTWALVRPHLPLLAGLCRTNPVRVLAVGAGRAAEQDAFPGLVLRDWSEASEVADVQEMDIGIMPVWDGPFQRGKSGYKLIQYMACGLPVVASPVGVNADIVRHGENGFLATTDAEWREALVRLIEDEPLRRRFGAAGRALAESEYSLASQAPRVVEILKTATGRPA